MLAYFGQVSFVVDKLIGHHDLEWGLEMGIGGEKAVEKFGSKDLEMNPNWTHSLAVHKNSDVPCNF